MINNKDILYELTKKPCQTEVAILAVTMLIGKEGEDFTFMEGPKDDPRWWIDYSKVHRN